MPAPWLHLTSGPGLAAFNMALDEALLEAVAHLGHVVFRTYAWAEPAATFGYFQRWTEVERMTLLRPLVRRPTGGGLVPHVNDWTYSLVVPPQHDWYALAAVNSYQRLHEWMAAAFALLGLPTQLAATACAGRPGQCFAGATQADLLWRGRKVAGAAQRRTRHGLLIQGSVQPIPEPLSRAELAVAVRQAATPGLAPHWLTMEPTADLVDRALRLADEKYSRQEYNRRR